MGVVENVIMWTVPMLLLFPVEVPNKVRAGWRMQWGRGAAVLTVECKTFYPLWWESTSLSSGKQRQGRFCKGEQLTDCKSQRYQGDQRSGMDKKCFEHRKIRRQKPSLRILWACSTTDPTEFGPTWEAWNCLRPGSHILLFQQSKIKIFIKRCKPPGMVMPTSFKITIS